MTPEQVLLTRPVRAVVIPDGIEETLEPGMPVLITQMLGGSFTIQTAEGRKYRIEGRDADAIGKPVPEEARAHEHTEPMVAADAEKLGWDLMKKVHDPEIPVNIVDLGLVYTLKMHTRGDGKLLAECRMTLTAPGCGMGDVLVRDVERQLASIPGVGAVDAKVVFDPVWNPYTMMSTAAKLKLGLL